MATLEKPMSAGLDQIETNAAKVQQLSSQVEELLGTPPDPLPLSTVSRLHWPSFAAGLGIGAAAVAIAGWLF